MNHKSCSVKNKGKHQDEGFTLVETIVGLALLSIIVVICWGSLMSGIETIDSIITANDNNFNILQLYESLNNDMANISYPVFAKYDDSKNTKTKLVFDYYGSTKNSTSTLEYTDYQLTLTTPDETIVYGKFENIEMEVIIEDVTMPHILISYNDTDILIPLEIPGA